MRKNKDFAIPEFENITFGAALEALKNGYNVARKGWNGKNMFLALKKGSLPCEDIELSKEDTNATLADSDNIITLVEGVSIFLFEAYHGNATVLPNIQMITPTGSIVNGWLASQTDMLAEDWCIKS